MCTILLALILSFLYSAGSENPTVVKSRSCSVVGVFHVEGRDRYNLTFEEAKGLCEHLSASIAQLAQVETSYEAGLQTCRHGWIGDRRTVILRHKPHKSCAGNQTGIKFFKKEYSDAFCYDAKDLSPKNCTAVSGIYSSGPEKLDGDPELVPTDTTLPESSTEVHWSNDQTDAAKFTATTKNRTTTGLEGIENTDHENSTSDITHLKDSTVFQIDDGSKIPIKTNEIDQTPVPGRDRETKNSDLLVILIVILAILLILLVCVVAATRQSCCGRKHTLITKPAKANGTTASFRQLQENITLMNIETNKSEMTNICLD